MTIEDFTQDFSRDFSDFNLQSTFTGAADGCTQCGICLSVCPTYKLNADISRSPMGRIQIMRNIREDDYVSSIEDYEALNSCLICRSCEVICPSRVSYSDMLGDAKSTLQNQYDNNFLLKLLLKLSERPGLLKFLSTTAKPMLPVFSFLDRYIRPEFFNKVRPGVYFLKNAKQKSGKLADNNNINPGLKKISLFTGCMSPIFDEPVLEATSRLLRHCGMEVTIPNKQTCCGALHQHNGQSKTTTELAIKNITTFADESADAVITTSSGCKSTLMEYNEILGEDAHCISNAADRFVNKVFDVSTYLFQNRLLETVQFSPCNQIVAIHTPCTQTSDEQNVVHQLLEKIPDVTLASLPTTIKCCGAGGSHLLTHQEMAKDIRNETLNALTELNADILVTSNVGCSLHLKEGINDKGLNIKVLHPVQLLEMQMKKKEGHHELVH